MIVVQTGITKLVEILPICDKFNDNLDLVNDVTRYVPNFGRRTNRHYKIST